MTKHRHKDDDKHDDVKDINDPKWSDDAKSRRPLPWKTSERIKDCMSVIIEGRTNLAP
jgi:hypothetical protein